MAKQQKIIKQPIDFKERLIHFSILSFAEVLRKLRTDFESGLDDDEVEYCNDRYGYNEIEETKKTTWYTILYESFINPLNLVLIIITFLSFSVDYYFAKTNKDLTSTIVISTMIFVGGILSFIQNIKSDNASQKLKEMITTTTTVLRNNEKTEVVIADVVPGDIIILSAGSIIPADLRILQAKDLFISQASLTGESAPVEKFSTSNEDNLDNNLLSPLELKNLCFMGTNVISGSGIGVVISIGQETYFGSMAKNISHNKVDTDFDKGINKIIWLLIKFVIVMSGIVFILNGFMKHNWLESFLFTISVAIGLTPEMLPVIITTNLAKGAIAMSKKKTIVKHLSSIQNFGAMDILCTDKTGTLTEDKIVLEYHLNIKGEDDFNVLKYTYLNSFYQTGLKNLLDLAVIDYMNSENNLSSFNNYILIDEVPFDFSRKRMSVILQKEETLQIELITKGAVEEMLTICDFVNYKDNIQELTDELKKEIINQVDKLNNEGMRVIAIGYKNNFDYKQDNIFSISDEKNLILIGFAAFLDPAKNSSAEAIKLLKEYGVKVKVLTGDNELVSKYVCKKVGIENTNVLLGKDIENMNDDQLKNIINDYDIYAKLSPQQKARIVALFREQDHVVGFMGDGINDAPAMKKSDVAISVDTAVDIAKESADIILLEKDLKVLANGVIEGRKIFGNILKYIKMATSSNFGNMFSILIACVFLSFLPMLPLQILILNLLYDVSQIVIPWDNLDEEYLKEQKKWNIKSIKSFMLFMGPVSSIFDILMFAVLYFIFKCNNPNNEYLVSFFQTGWFLLSLISQTLIIHFIRTNKIPFIESRASFPVIFMTLGTVLIAIALPFSFLGKFFKLIPMPMAYFWWLILLLCAYFVVISFIKRIYIKKYGNWL